MGPYGYGKRNDRGDQQVHFCQENKLTIVNTFYKKWVGKRWTWLAPNSTYKTEIDYILTPYMGQINKFKILLNKFPFNTDHRLLKIEIPL